MHAVDWYVPVEIPFIALSASRWVFVAALCVYSSYKKSLTAWIMTSMVLGILIGLEFREFSQHLAFLRQIFLNLVKTIVAPLLFPHWLLVLLVIPI